MKTRIGHHLLDRAYPKKHREMALDAKSLESLAGRYQLGPNSILTIARSGDHLYVGTDRDRFEIFPEGPEEFYAKVNELTITFELDAQGNATGLVSHFGALDLRGKRIE